MSKLAYLIIGLAVFLAGILASIVFLKSGILVFDTAGDVAPKKTGKESSASGYQAVFLANNQVYFGRLSGYGTNSTPTLREVYYFHLAQSLQEPSPLGISTKIKPGAAVSKPPAPSSEMVLVKLGNEMHGPVDEIKFNIAQIFFVEDLREDSKVVQAIKDYREKNK